jgi:hypothetical protein
MAPQRPPEPFTVSLTVIGCLWVTVYVMRSYSY